MSDKALVYLRVSTTEQNLENQRSELERICDQKDWKIVEVLTEESSGYQGEREEFKKLFKMAHRHKYDVLVTWSLDRLDRRGIQQTLNSLQRLDEHDIQFYSYQEPYLTTLDPHTRELVISLLSWVANMESRRRSERTKAGLERARSQGKKIGRPPKTTKKEREHIRTLYNDKNHTISDIEDVTDDLSRSTIHRIVSNNGES